MSSDVTRQTRTTNNKKALISQGLFYYFALLWIFMWCPEPGSNRHSIAAEGF